MTSRFLLLFYLLSLNRPAAWSQEKIRVHSPDGKIVYTFWLSSRSPEYCVSYLGDTLISPSGLGLTFQKEGIFREDLRTGQVLLRKGTDHYHLVVGKTSSVFDHYNEAWIPLESTRKTGFRVGLRIRVFDDGLAFRYEFLKLGSDSTFVLTQEHTSFHLKGDPEVLALFFPDFTSSHETRYTRLPLDRITPDSLMDLPALFTFRDSIYMAITEADLLDYAGMYLVKHKGVLLSRLSPWPGQQKIKVRGRLPHTSPWRVLMISDRPGTLIESNILTDLSEPCRIRDISWIKPGKTDFHWWNGDIMPDTDFAPGINDEFNKYYIDFCAANGIAYHTVIGYGGVAWYKNDGVSYSPGPHSDATRPLPGLHMKQLCSYAASKGVMIRVWVNWQVLYPELEKACSLYQKWGVRGIMVDFLNRDDQQMVRIQTRILRVAAKYHLNIVFHGAYKPTGLSRTYPNEFGREGTLNYENDKWGNPITPDDDINIPFTRLLAGPTDYHLGGFRAVIPSRYKAHYTRPLVLGTRCHMLAMYIILENYMGMVCDYPQAYLGQPGFGFLRIVPTVWDQTVVPDALVGNWVTIARRKGSDWFIGTINNSKPRVIHIPLNFLGPGQYLAYQYCDAPDANQHPNHLVRQVLRVRSGQVLDIWLASGGGQVIHLVKQ